MLISSDGDGPTEPAWPGLWQQFGQNFEFLCMRPIKKVLAQACFLGQSWPELKKGLTL